MSFTTINIAKRANCPACQGNLKTVVGERLAWLCGQDTANINPEKPLKLDLAQVSQTIQQQQLAIRVKSSLALMFNYKKLEVSLFANGRMLIKNVKDENQALNAYREITRTLNLH
jgi:adenylyltransferase/sulfurtransferase